MTTSPLAFAASIASTNVRSARGAFPVPYNSSINAFASRSGLDARRRMAVVSKDGTSLTTIIFVSMSKCTLKRPFGCGSSKDVLTSTVSPTVARGWKLGEEKASKFPESAFLHRDARKSLSSKKRHTSGISRVHASDIENSRFLRASENVRQNGICDPVNTTVFARFSSMKERADAE
eukprot:CAMPEP_0180301090 /NCGR_PEP_ID=MMETSP0988-20121125/23237_1 /TAXON_ID=697907 /ORGANISM="non described non described, Strain CCMP2293" /LENGTH=176 /DNA_ID=CAMNT_0022281493 /DNA_START=336 /DNA_END=866 /DNA_ORIENTATION=-